MTIGDETYPLPEPFLVLATQNPIEQEGTYPLPEAQVDRFMLKLRVGYPTREEERQILDRMATTRHRRPRHAGRRHRPTSSRRAALVDQIYIDDKIKDYIVDLVFATREPAAFELDLGAAHRVRRLAARHDLPDARRARRTPSSRAAATSRRRT